MNIIELTIRRNINRMGIMLRLPAFSKESFDILHGHTTQLQDLLKDQGEYEENVDESMTREMVQIKIWILKPKKK